MNEAKIKFSLSEWILFFLSTLVIFLSSIILATATLIIYIGEKLIWLLSWRKRSPVVIILTLITIFFLINIIYWTVLPVGWKNEEEKVSIVVKKGESLSNVAGKLKGKGLGFSRTIFLGYSKISGFDKHIHVGKYEFQKGNTLYQILSKLRKGKITPIDVTIPEGLNFRQIAGILQNKCGTDSSLFVAAVTDEDFIKEINISAENLEGYLYPNTYKLYWGIEPYDVAGIMVDHLKGILVDSLRQRAEEFGFSINQIITLASLIESEARKPEERTIISAVYHNRLQKGMLLQCDPTVIYALPELNRPLLLKDLEIDSPYNTYIHAGLPPGPINNPGKESILAALYPANVDFLYFVAKGDGSHVFSSTLEEHNRAIRRIKSVNSYESKDRSS